jgi:hypothetical protein
MSDKFFEFKKNSILKNSEKKEDDDQNFIKKDSPESQETKFSEVKESTQTKEIIEKLKDPIFPKNNQQRSLDVEIGGLESEEKKEISSEDVWDNRSEEVDKMGSIDTFNSTGIRSVIAKRKRERLELAKKIAAGKPLTKTEKKIESSENQSHLTRLKNLRQDRSHEINKNGGSRGF